MQLQILTTMFAKARGYQRKVDRRRSQTFKSITVPEEVLQVAVDDEYQLPEDDDFDEYGEPLFATTGVIVQQFFHCTSISISSSARGTSCLKDSGRN